MRRIIKFTTKLASLFIFILLSLTVNSPVQAQWTGDCVETVTTNGRQVEVATIGGLECLMSRILNAAIGLVGLAVLAMFVLGGYKLLTSGGDPKGIEAGKNTLTYAVIGLVLVILSYFIILLIANFTGATQILDFNVGDIDQPGGSSGIPGSGPNSGDLEN